MRPRKILLNSFERAIRGATVRAELSHERLPFRAKVHPTYSSQPKRTVFRGRRRTDEGPPPAAPRPHQGGAGIIRVVGSF